MIDPDTGEVKSVAYTLMPRREGDQLALNKALFKAQGMFKVLPKNGTIEKSYQDKNTKQWKTFKIKYALIEDVFPAAIETLQQCGIYIQQEPFPCLQDGNLYVMTSLIHVGTEEEDGTGASKSYFYPVCSLQGLNQQDAAGANTSAKRLAVIEGLFLVAEEDKDCDRSKARTSGSPQGQPEPAKAPYRPVEKITKAPAPKAPATPEKPATEQPGKPVSEQVAGKQEESVPSKGDMALGTELWKAAKSDAMSLDELNALTEKARKIESAQVSDPVLKALRVRELIFRAMNESDIAAARKVLSTIPEKLRTDKVFEKMIDAKDATLAQTDKGQKQ